MSEPRGSYTVTAQPVTITISKEWADFLTRIQSVHSEYRSHHIERIAIVDLHNLEIGQVIAFRRGK